MAQQNPDTKNSSSPDKGNRKTITKVGELALGWYLELALTLKIRSQRRQAPSTRI